MSECITWMYVVRCSDKTLYCGVTNDLERRLNEHNKGTKGARYTRFRKPVEVVFTEQFESRGEALRAEYAFKQLTKKKKEAIVDGTNN